MCIGHIDLKRGYMYMGKLSSDFDNKSKFKVTWKIILKQAAPYNPTLNQCNLHLWKNLKVPL